MSCFCGKKGQVHPSKKSHRAKSVSSRENPKTRGSEFERITKIRCMFCGGATCKNENWLRHPNAAIEGLHSDWITEDILAMQRPSERLIQEYNILEQFQDNGILAVLNVQLPGEHPSCGDGIIDKCGFSYNPETLSDAGIKFFNFGWWDMTVPTLDHMLNVVQVMALTIESDNKIAVHCHAGFGRTGLAIACYLIFAESRTPEEAITMVRDKRPKSLQTRAQRKFVAEFEKYLGDMRIIFFDIKQSQKPLTLREHLKRQNNILYGEEREHYYGVPKILKVILDHIVHQTTELNVISFNEIFEVLEMFYNAEFKVDEETTLEGEELIKHINKGDWDCIANVSNVKTLFYLLDKWFETLEAPPITSQQTPTLRRHLTSEYESLASSRRSTRDFQGAFYTTARNETRMMMLLIEFLVDIGFHSDTEKGDILLEGLARMVIQRDDPSVIEPMKEILEKNLPHSEPQYLTP
mmetsp:Transcript_2771/g.2927  ORF Transcript_2771/g.2927 Transcript_2771/m.2927 type:complete len:466 (-) Transcript_2771:584-1981(-)